MYPRRLIAVAPVAALILAACQKPTATVVGSSTDAPLFDGMGSHHRAVTTRSPITQRYFDQGLVWAYAFNHDEAIRSFGAAAKNDPQCAMAYWGIALCNGPHINFPIMLPERSQAAWDALQQAQARKALATPVERELIEALSKRYANPEPADRRGLDEAYAAAMEVVWKKYPNDPDVGSLYAESLMDLQPWDLWTKQGQPKGRTVEIVGVLEEVLRTSPNHPGANHLYIHAVEAGPTPEKGIASAERLRNMVPAAGHLMHMPSHIDVQVGEWAKASDQNVAAAAADRRYREISPRQGFYRVYMAHNDHFLAFSAMMEGRSATALEAARRMVAGVPEDYARKDSTLVDPYMMVVLDVLKRFGLWDDVLEEPDPPAYLPITTAYWHYARGVAFAAKGQLDAARREQAEFRAATAKIPPDAMMAINKAHQVLAIADKVLAAEIALRDGHADQAIALLREGVQFEDQLMYMEPPEWIQPARHTLGAVLLSEGRVGDAEVVYREDLAIWPENGWSLYGLASCLDQAGKKSDAADVWTRFDKVWQRSDVKIGSSCACVGGRS